MPAGVRKVASVLVTDVGMVREHNEDSAYADPEGRFFLVADGMGGHAAGEVASAMVVEQVRIRLEAGQPTLDAYVKSPDEASRFELVKLLEGSVRAAHQEVFERGAREADKKGMGTTVEAVLVVGEDAFVAHVGDSRTYLIRGNQATQVTTDHTVAEVLVIEGKLSPEEGRLSPLRTILVNAVGVSADVGVELAHLKLRKNDRLLLCSDGLHDYFPADAEFVEILARMGSEAGIRELVKIAKDRGGHDNITGIVVDVVTEPRSTGQLQAAEAGDAQGSVPQALNLLEETAPLLEPEAVTASSAAKRTLGLTSTAAPSPEPPSFAKEALAETAEMPAVATTIEGPGVDPSQDPALDPED